MDERICIRLNIVSWDKLLYILRDNNYCQRMQNFFLQEYLSFQTCHSGDFISDKKRKDSRSKNLDFCHYWPFGSAAVKLKRVAWLLGKGFEQQIKEE